MEKFLLQKELVELFKEGWVREEEVRKILEIAKIALPEKQKFSISQMKAKLILFFEKGGKIFSYKEDQKEATILINKGFYYNNLIIELKWNNEIGKNELKFTIDEQQRKDIYYEVNQKAINLKIFGTKRISDTQIEVFFENPIEEEKLYIELWDNEKLFDLCFLEIIEIIKIIPEILAKPYEVRKKFEELICKIDSREIIMRHRNKNEKIFIESCGVKTKVEANYGEGSYVIECIENEEKNPTDCTIIYTGGNYCLKIEKDLVHFKVPKQSKNTKLILEIIELYKKQNFEFFSEDSNKIEISISRRKLNINLRKKVDEIEEKIYNSNIILKMKI